MKKGNILIAAFAVVMAAASAAKAEVRVDFDGSAPGTESFTEALKATTALDSDDLAPLPVSIIEPYPCTGVAILPFPGPCDNFTPGQSIQPNPYYPGACAAVCFGTLTADCRCVDPWQNIWEQEGGELGYICKGIPSNSWAGMAKCGPGADLSAVEELTQPKSTKSSRTSHPALQKKLRKILLGYCNTYPEFAEAVLPMLKDDKAKITTHNGFVYIMSGNSIMRLGGAISPESDGLSRKGGGLGIIGAIVEAAGAVNDAINAWNDYGSWPPVPDNGTADDYHGPALTVKPEDGVPVIYDNIQVQE